MKLPQDVPALVHGLLEAARKGDVGAVARMLDEGVSVDACDFTGETALARAANHRHLDLIRFLLARGADPNWLDVYDETPLSLAARAYTPAAFSLLWPLSNETSRRIGLKRAIVTQCTELGWKEWTAPVLPADRREG